MIWQVCEGEQHISELAGTLYRLVESQEQVATLGYVDTLEEQALLEELLEQVKPPYPHGMETYHYLLKTPFRYPPLKWGSRFGRVHEPGIFYGGSTAHVTLAESAYYRFVFWHSMDAVPPKDSIRSAHTLFSVKYKTARGVALQQPPFDQHQSSITDPQHYTATQQLGSAMRDAGVVAFQYPSARDAEHGLCVGLFSPKAFTQKRPTHLNPWLCEITATEVAFKQLGQSQVNRFGLECFLKGGKLPLPA